MTVPPTKASGMAPEEIESALRREWWINHGHDYYALYGDDGEMQCGRCAERGIADFKRTPLAELRDHVQAVRLANAAEIPYPKPILESRE